jgi:hypothetical protein
MKYNLANDGFRGVVDMLAREECDINMDILSLQSGISNEIDPDLVAQALDHVFGVDVVRTGDTGTFSIILYHAEWQYVSQLQKEMIGEFNRYHNIHITLQLIKNDVITHRSARSTNTNR